MNTTFMNSKKNKTSDPHRLLLNLTEKNKLKEKYVVLSKHSVCYTPENIKKS